jgi:lantibiotic modifying enzyme
MEEKKFFDFRGTEEFNLNDEYSKLFGEEEFKPSNPNETKLKDAESIIEELGSKYIEGLSLQKYEKIFVNLTDFLTKFRTDSEEVQNMTEQERSKLFGYAKELFSSYQQQYSNLQFNFELSIKEWNFIEHTLTKKLSYNGQELFNYWELYVKFLQPTRELVGKLPKDLEAFIPICSVQSLILLSHLIMKHEEKASTDSFHYFRTVLTEVAKMTKLFNAYGVMLERATNRFNHWVDAINAMDGYNNDGRIDNSEQEQQ